MTRWGKASVYLVKTPPISIKETSSSSWAMMPRKEWDGTRAKVRSAISLRVNKWHQFKCLRMQQIIQLLASLYSSQFQVALESLVRHQRILWWKILYWNRVKKAVNVSNRLKKRKRCLNRLKKVDRIFPLTSKSTINHFRIKYLWVKNLGSNITCA